MLIGSRFGIKQATAVESFPRPVQYYQVNPQQKERSPVQYSPRRWISFNRAMTVDDLPTSPGRDHGGCHRPEAPETGSASASSRLPASLKESPGQDEQFLLVDKSPGSHTALVQSHNHAGRFASRDPSMVSVQPRPPNPILYPGLDTVVRQKTSLSKAASSSDSGLSNEWTTANGHQSVQTTFTTSSVDYSGGSDAAHSFTVTDITEAATPQDCSQWVLNSFNAQCTQELDLLSLLDEVIQEDEPVLYDSMSSSDRYNQQPCAPVYNQQYLFTHVKSEPNANSEDIFCCGPVPVMQNALDGLPSGPNMAYAEEEEEEKEEEEEEVEEEEKEEDNDEKYISNCSDGNLMNCTSIPQISHSRHFGSLFSQARSVTGDLVRPYPVLPKRERLNSCSHEGIQEFDLGPKNPDPIFEIKREKHSCEAGSPVATVDATFIQPGDPSHERFIHTPPMEEDSCDQWPTRDTDCGTNAYMFPHLASSKEGNRNLQGDPEQKRSHRTASPTETKTFSILKNIAEVKQEVDSSTTDPDSCLPFCLLDDFSLKDDQSDSHLGDQDGVSAEGLGDLLPSSSPDRCECLDTGERAESVASLGSPDSSQSGIFSPVTTNSEWCSDSSASSSPRTSPYSEDMDESTGSPDVGGCTKGRKKTPLWKFLHEMLSNSSYENCITWLDRTEGIFKIMQSKELARLWGMRKNYPNMNYDKMSRSLRQYYKKGVLKKTRQAKRLVYQFCPKYSDASS